jgi:hypothetical protein
MLWAWVKQANIQIDMANGACILIEVGKTERIHKRLTSLLGNSSTENDGDRRLLALELRPN